HPSSNYRMTLAALLSHVPIPPEQIHPVPTDTGSPEKAAALYEQTLQNFYGAKVLDPARPLFDVTLLGLGTDGHTASLFPGTAALDEQKAWVTSIVGVKEEPRISLTYPALGSSESILFLVSGAEKKEMLKRVLDNDQTLPAARIATTGRIIIYTDAAAALD
ncbi:MAG TPA: 6-phosphogluconolactonase, partial [Beijerinckia sp.]|nr:6-phosphogluconolactonase [Beijerinckia sp.]